MKGPKSKTFPIAAPYRQAGTHTCTKKYTGLLPTRPDVHILTFRYARLQHNTDHRVDTGSLPEE